MTPDCPNVIKDSRYSVNTAAKHLGVSRSTIYRAFAEGSLAYIVARNGRRIILGRDIVAFWSANY